MASLHKVQQHGRTVFRVGFYDVDGNRRFIRLGAISKKTAESIQLHVGQLADCMNAGQLPDKSHFEWASRISQDLSDKLAAAGLLPKRESGVLGAFLQAYIDGRLNSKPRTVNNLGQAKGFLVKFFGENKKLREISEGDVLDFREWIFSQVGENTARRHLGRAKQFFRYAAKKKLVSSSPFGDLAGVQVQENRERDYFVTREDAAKVLEACPNAQWRLLFALCRFQGMRCPSELTLLQWQNIDWAESTMTIHSPKTEHHAGKEMRTAPIFPEVLPLLREAFEASAEGDTWVLPICRDDEVNLRTQLKRIIVRAGIKPWPKLFVNLRATCATELADNFPDHVCNTWMGHSKKIANKHYRQVTAEHLAKAKSGAQGGARVAQTVAPSTHAPAPTRSAEAAGKPREMRTDAEGRAAADDEPVPPAGFEPTTFCLGNRCSIQLSYEGGKSIMW